MISTKRLLEKLIFIRSKVTLKTLVFSINKREPSEEFARQFLTQADAFLQAVQAYREMQIEQEGTPHLQELTQAQDS